MLISQFVYKLLCIYSPIQEFIDQVRKLITEFIWDKKPARIAYRNLIQDYRDGGLKLVDLAVKDISLKASWVDKLMLNGDIQMSFLKKAFPIAHPGICSCYISPQDIYKIMPFGIARDIWVAWSNFNYKSPASPYDVLDQTIWFTSYLHFS